MASLRAAFPGVEEDVLKKKLAEADGNVEKALVSLFADQKKPAVAPAVETSRDKLAAVFPGVSAERLDAVLKESDGNVDAAAAKLLVIVDDTPPAAAHIPAAAAAAAPKDREDKRLEAPAEKKRRTPVQMLAVVFPEVELSLLEMALKESGNDIERATEWLNGGGAPPPAKRPAADVAAAAAAAAAAGVVSPDEENHGEVRVIEWEEGAVYGGYMGGHYVKRGKKRVFVPGPAIPAKPGRSRRATIKIDMTRPCQSLRDLPQDPVRMLQPILSSFGDNAQFALYCFQTMLEREQQLYPKGFFCFYHSYSYASLLYEVQAELARAIHELPDDFAPLPRILRGPFDEMPLMEMLLDDYKKLGNDHNPKYRALAISTSNSLFAPGSEAPPTSCFMMGYSCMDLSFRGLLTGLFEACHVPHYKVEDLADACIDVGEKYKLATAPYRSRPGGAGMAYVPGVGGPRGITESPGNMLQLFVHRDYVDSVAYSSRPYGVPTGDKSIAKVLSHGTCDGQARVFVHPDVFTDTKKSRLFHYCANANLACMDPLVPGSRGAMIQELRKALAPIVGDYTALRKARRGIQGMPGSQDP